MLSRLAAALTLGVFLAGSAQAQTPPKREFVKVATCTGLIYGDPTTLEFLREIVAGKPSLKGVMRHTDSYQRNSEGKISFGADEDNGTQISIYYTTDEARKFAEFSLPKAAKSQVYIWAPDFQVTWIIADCVR